MKIDKMIFHRFCPTLLLSVQSQKKLVKVDGIDIFFTRFLAHSGPKLEVRQVVQTEKPRNKTSEGTEREVLFRPIRSKTTV